MASQSLKLGNIKPENAIFFMCDIQEKFRPVIKYFKEILEIAEKLVCLYSLASVTLTLYSTFITVYGYLLKYTPIFRFGQCRHILFWVLDRHRPGGLNPNWWSIPILHIYQNGSHTFLFNSECVITLPVYLSKHKWETLPLTIKGHDFVECYISLFCT